MTKFKAYFLLNLLVILVYVLIETLRPERKIDFRKVIWADFSSTLVGIIMLFMLGYLIFGVFKFKLHLSIYSWFHTKAFYIQFISFFLAHDFLMYWAHRFMHTKHMWRTHRWHHYPKYMYWGAGFRSSIIHNFLFTSTGILTLPILAETTSVFYYVFTSTIYMISNNFMHMNVSWNSWILEWFIVTPRYHHVHHSDKISEHNGNYGATLTIWDRLFGSYINPDNIKNIQYGTGEKEKHFWQFIGL